MTSMLLTLNRAPGAGEAAGLRPGAMGGLASSLRAVARGDALLSRIFGRRGFHHVADQLSVRLNPAADDFPLLAVPLLELHRAAALVVQAGDFQRLDEALGPELLDALLVEVQVFESPANLFAGERLLSVLALCSTNGFGADDAGHDSAVVQDAANPGLVRHVSQAFGVDVLLDFLDDF